ncbi:MAG: FHA domain-containing protein [Myxococcota bacterium]
MNAAKKITKRPRRQIRVISGPLQGTVHTINSRLHIGRSGSSDIQLIDDDVSRQHAEVVENIYGEHILVDLDSSNGKLVGGRRIRRTRLKPGMVFEIMRTKFAYEDAVEQPVDEELTRPHQATTTSESLRETTDYGALDLPAPVLSSQQRPSPYSRTKLEGQCGHHMRAIDDDGVAYEGNLISDVLEFRRMLARFLRSDGMEREELRRFSDLETRLRLPKDEAASADLPSSYRRFFCSMHSRVRFAAIGSIPAVMIDFGVDGAQILAYHHGMLVGSMVWLSMDVISDGRPRTVVFTSRVRWSSNNYAGLLFTGEPIPSSEERTRTRKETRRHLQEQADIVKASLQPLELRRVDRSA